MLIIIITHTKFILLLLLLLSTLIDGEWRQGRWDSSLEAFQKAGILVDSPTITKEPGMTQTTTRLKNQLIMIFLANIHQGPSDDEKPENKGIFTKNGRCQLKTEGS